MSTNHTPTTNNYILREHEGQSRQKRQPKRLTLLDCRVERFTASIANLAAVLAKSRLSSKCEGRAS